jgi:peptidoglycan/LPS O-acetylase OafA/YrhL
MRSDDSMQNPAARYYRPGLDVVRFTAFMLVFFGHSLPGPPPFRIFNLFGPGVAAFCELAIDCWRFGLSLFFTLSGFLIFELLQRERRSTGTLGVKQFYIRRILRIWPLYYLALALGAMWAFRFGNGAADLPALGWFAVFLGSWFVNAHGWLGNPVDPLWSISVEEQFYLLAPWLAKYCSRRLLFIFCALVVVVANCALYLVAKPTDEDAIVWTNSFIQFECFAAGIFLSLYLNGRVPMMRLGARVLVLVGAAASWLVAAHFLSAFYQPSSHSSSWQLMITYGLAASGSGLILLAMLGFQGGPHSRWAIHLGQISYGLYVFHRFALDLFERIPMEKTGINAFHSHVLRGALFFGVRIAAPLLATVVLAELSYRFFERPFLRIKERHGVIISRPGETVGSSAIAAPR